MKLDGRYGIFLLSKCTEGRASAADYVNFVTSPHQRMRCGTSSNMLTRTRPRHCKSLRGRKHGVVSWQVRGLSRGTSQAPSLKDSSSPDTVLGTTTEPAATFSDDAQASQLSNVQEPRCWPHRRAGALPKTKYRLFQVCLTVAALSLGCVSLAPPAHASIAEAVSASLRSVAPDWLVVVVLASLPVVELRGAVPVGISILGISPPVAYILAVFGNMIPVPLILLCLGPLVKASAGVPPLYKILEAILSRARKQTEAMDEDTIFLGLAYFVAVPLPGTGAWSGAIAAFVLDVPFWPAVLSNCLGVCCAGLLVTMLTCMGWTGLWLAIIILLLLPLLSFLVNSMRTDPKR